MNLAVSGPLSILSGLFYCLGLFYKAYAIMPCGAGMYQLILQSCCAVLVLCYGGSQKRNSTERGKNGEGKTVIYVRVRNRRTS